MWYYYETGCCNLSYYTYQYCFDDTECYDRRGAAADLYYDCGASYYPHDSKYDLI